MVKGFEIRTFSEHAPASVSRDRDGLLALFAQGRIRPLVDGRYPLREVEAAMRSLTERRATGRVIVLPFG